MSEIKPCPFCGEVPEYVDWWPRASGFWAEVRCANLECPEDEVCSSAMRPEKRDAFAHAVARWNARAAAREKLVRG